MVFLSSPRVAVKHHNCTSFGFFNLRVSMASSTGRTTPWHLAVEYSRKEKTTHREVALDLSPTTVTGTAV